MYLGRLVEHGPPFSHSLVALSAEVMGSWAAELRFDLKFMCCHDKSFARLSDPVHGTHEWFQFMCVQPSVWAKRVKAFYKK